MIAFNLYLTQLPLPFFKLFRKKAKIYLQENLMIPCSKKREKKKTKIRQDDF